MNTNKSIDINNKKDLEKIFADNFATPVFPMLAEMYLKENDLRRADLVCSIGLKNSPHNINGQFMHALVLIEQKEFVTAKKLLKKIIVLNPLHLNAKYNLLHIAHIEKQKPLTLYNLSRDILKIDPNYQPAINFVEAYLKTNNKIQKNKSGPDKQVHSIDESFDINKNVASLTLALILKSQGHFIHALDVLNLLDQNKQEVQKEISTIKSLIADKK